MKTGCGCFKESGRKWLRIVANNDWNHCEQDAKLQMQPVLKLGCEGFSESGEKVVANICEYWLISLRIRP